MNRFDQFQIDALEVAFQESDHLSRERKVELVNQTGLDVEQVTSWFNRRRKRERERQTRKMRERRNSEVEQALLESRDREANLQREVEESRRRESELRDEIENLRLQIGILGENMIRGWGEFLDQETNETEINERDTKVVAGSPRRSHRNGILNEKINGEN